VKRNRNVAGILHFMDTYTILIFSPKQVGPEPGPSSLLLSKHVLFSLGLNMV
jgi:hypothetical protein